jgi:hypothetical protein
MSMKLKVCIDRVLPRDQRRILAQRLTGPSRAALLVGKKWPNGSTLRVRFLGGSAAQQAIVKQFAPQWCQHANLKLEFGEAADAEIRITFQDDDGAWSYIGTDCKDIPLHQPTMNLGWQDEGVVLHEFGHAIGLIHEHQNPHGGIQWNKPNVYRDLGGPPNNWDKETIDHNMFATYDVQQINGTALDKKSIMLYAIPKAWTVDGFQSEPNEVLSATDKAFIGEAKNYPFAQGPATAVELPVLEMKPTQASIGKAGERDLFRFSAAKPGRFTIETEGSTDVVMSLYGPNSSTKLLSEDDDSGADRNAKITADLGAGTYYVQVRHYGSGIGSYGFRVSR